MEMVFSDLGLQSATFHAGPYLLARKELQEFSRGDYNICLLVSASV